MLASGVSLFLFLGTLVAIPVMLVRMPADYFVRRPVRSWPNPHPAFHITLAIIKNLVGVFIKIAEWLARLTPQLRTNQLPNMRPLLDRNRGNARQWFTLFILEHRKIAYGKDIGMRRHAQIGFNS